MAASPVGIGDTLFRRNRLPSGNFLSQRVFESGNKIRHSVATDKLGTGQYLHASAGRVDCMESGTREREHTSADVAPELFDEQGDWERDG